MSAKEPHQPRQPDGPRVSTHLRVRRRSVALAAGTVLVLGMAASLMPAHAQSWWPFGGDEEPARPPVPREPVYRQPPPAPIPEPQPQPAPGVAPGVGSPGTANWSTKNPICLQLEQRLVQEGQKGNQSRDQLARVEAELRQVDRTFNIGASKLDANCYEAFLFTRSFRNTPQCKELAKQVEVSKRRLAELEAQRQDLSSGRSYQDDIIRELARNNCGANYADQARRRSGGDGMWSEEGDIGSNNWTPYGSNGETYRTVCVRLCDGYYFPVSFSTLPSHFAQDAEVCSSKCAAPAQLYYYRNPGGAMDQAVALQSNDPYTKLKTAFRYRKEYVTGCSCKAAEYVPASTADQKAERSKPPQITTGSTADAASATPSGWEVQPIPESEGQ
ncbi:MAG TPA: DUF2865 domain-containing protein [Hyphomicrobium sp.]|nr:DUF2865 domain-containing protein [Hyphomicrobium sp.]